MCSSDLTTGPSEGRCAGSTGTEAPRGASPTAKGRRAGRSCTAFRSGVRFGGQGSPSGEAFGTEGRRCAGRGKAGGAGQGFKVGGEVRFGKETRAVRAVRGPNRAVSV